MSEKEFTKNWFQVSAIEPHLAHLKNKNGLKFLDIGTFEGRSACWFLDNFDCHVISIDPCVVYPVPGHEYINESMYPFIIKNLEPYGDRVTFLKAYSHDVLPGLPRNSFDFIYVDGDHRYVTVLDDASLSWPLLKSGGVIIFDDYLWSYDPKRKENPDSPHDAIDLFIQKHIDELEILARSYHVVLRKR